MHPKQKSRLAGTKHQHKTMMIPCFVSCLAALLVGQASAGTIQYLKNPVPVWQRNLGSKNRPGLGNAVVLSPDESALYVTSSSGNLAVIDPRSGQILEEIVVPKNDRSWDVSCKSGVSVSEQYLVYAVTDEPPEDDYSSRKQSRVIAVDHKTFKVRWISKSLEGEVVGTPVISSDGAFVFFTRNSYPAPTAAPTTSPTAGPTNTPTLAPTGEPTKEATDTPTLSPTQSPSAAIGNATERLLQLRESTVAYFTILSDNPGDSVFLEEASTDFSTITNHNYGPVAIARNVVRGQYQGGDGNSNDVVVWHSRKSANTRFGETQLFQFPSNVTSETLSFLKLKSVQLGSVTWTSQAAPTMTKSGQELFIGTSKGEIQGWVDGQWFDLLSNYEMDLEGIPSANTAVLSKDETLLFVTTSGGTMEVVDIVNKTNHWSVEANDEKYPIATKPVISPDNMYVFYPRGSQLFAKMVDNGDNVWNVANRDGSFVVADFCVSSDGRFLYYAGFETDNFVTQLRIAIPTEPTQEPSMAPSMAPTITPMPTISPMPTKAPTTPPPVPASPTPAPVTTTDGESSSSNDTVLYAAVAGGVIGFLALVLLGFGLVKFVRGRADDGIDTDYNFDHAPASNHERQEGPKIAKPQRYSYDPTRI